MAYNQCRPIQTIVCPPKMVNRDIFVPQPVRVVHPIEIVNRYHTVPVPYHVTTVVCRNEVNANVSSRRRRKRKR